MADVYINALKGLDKNMLEFITNQVIERKGDNVYVYTREMIRWHKEQNHRILFRPDKTLATILSIVLPGTGQIYSGDFKSGMNSILLLGGLYFIGSTLSVTGFIIVIPFLYRYYVGGILNARQAAEAKQKEKQHIFYLKMMEVILE